MSHFFIVVLYQIFKFWYCDNFIRNTVTITYLPNLKELTSLYFWLLNVLLSTSWSLNHKCKGSLSNMNTVCNILKLQIILAEVCISRVIIQRLVMWEQSVRMMKSVNIIKKDLTSSNCLKQLIYSVLLFLPVA